MVDETGRVRQIAWLDVFPWLRLIRCPRLSLTISLVVLGFLGWLGMTAGWRFFAYCWSESADLVVQKHLTQLNRWPGDYPLYQTPASLELSLPDYSTVAAASKTLVGVAEIFSLPAFALFDRELGFSGFCFFFICTIWSVLVWSIFGAAMTRIAALALTREHKLGLSGGLKFGLLHWPSYVGGPALPLAACLLLAVPLLMLGWISHLDIGAFFVSVIWPLALVGGGLIALLALGLMLGWPLMWPTISTEATDAFDGLSRAYSYTLHRPLRYFFYVMLGGVLGALLLYVVIFLVFLVQGMTSWAFSIGTGITRFNELQIQVPGNPDVSALESGANHVFRFWNRLLQLIPLAVAASYFWTAMTQIYLLLRRDEDGAELDEVFLPAQDKEFGLPPLKTDAAGVPSVVEPTPQNNSSPDDTAMGSGS